MLENDATPSYDGKGVMVPFDFFYLLVTYYHGRGPRQSYIPDMLTGDRPTLVPEPLFAKMMAAWQGTGLRAWETPPPEPETANKVEGSKTPTFRLSANPEWPKIVPKLSTAADPKKVTAIGPKA